MDKDKKRARRRSDEQKHLKKRIKRYMNKHDAFLLDDELVLKISAKELLKHYKWLNVYKSTGTPCSCSMCSHGKYDRLKDKKRFDDDLRHFRKDLNE